MKETLPFVVGTGAALLGIKLVANGIQEVQFGPRWEVPVAAEGKLFGFGIISVLLYLVGIFSYVRGDRFASQTPMNRGGFWFLLCVGAVLNDPEFRSRPRTVADNPPEFVCYRTQKFDSNIDSLRTFVGFVDSSKPTAILTASALINGRAASF